MKKTLRFIYQVISLKFFHYLSLFLAGGLGVANGLLVKTHNKHNVIPSTPVQQTMVLLARLGLVALIVLWITGYFLTYQIYGSFKLGWAFHLKLFGASALLLVVTFLNYHLYDCGKKGVSTNPQIMKVIPIVARASLLLVLIGIAILTS